MRFRSFRSLGLPIYVARVPAAPFAHHGRQAEQGVAATAAFADDLTQQRGCPLSVNGYRLIVRDDAGLEIKKALLT